MRAIPVVLVPMLLVTLLAGMRASDEPPIDVARGKQLMRKFQAGAKLTREEQAYLERVKQEIRKRAAGKRGGPVPSAPARPLVVNTNDWNALVPITDMTSPYKGQDGGLYGRGMNEPPEAHLRGLPERVREDTPARRKRSAVGQWKNRFDLDRFL